MIPAIGGEGLSGGGQSMWGGWGMANWPVNLAESFKMLNFGTGAGADMGGMLHELGHSFGFPHSPDGHSVMSPAWVNGASLFVNPDPYMDPACYYEREMALKLQAHRWFQPDDGQPIPEKAWVYRETNLLPQADDLTSYSLGLSGTAKAHLSIEGKTLRIDVEAIDGVNWHVLLKGQPVQLEDGKIYNVRFQARADKPRQILITGQIDVPDYRMLGLDQNIHLTPELQTYQVSFRASGVLAQHNRVPYVSLGGATGTVWIKDVAVFQYGH